jgi:hypothetical protein
MGLSGDLNLRDRAIIVRDYEAAVAALHELDAGLWWHRRHEDHL